MKKAAAQNLVGYSQVLPQVFFYSYTCIHYSGNLPGIQNTKKRFLPPARCTISGKSSKIMKPAINQTILKQNSNHRPTSGASLSPHRVSSFVEFYWFTLFTFCKFSQPSRIPVRVTSSVTRASIEDSLSMLLIKEISLMKKLYDVRLEIEQLDHDSTRWIYVPSQFSMKKNEANRLSCLTSSPFLSSQVSI